jgi:hypothetical protein
MKRWTRWAGLPALGAILLLLAGCGGGGSGNHTDQWDTQIISAYSYVVQDVQDENLSDLMGFVSPYYLQDGIDYNGFQSEFADFFSKYKNIRMDVNIRSITYDNNDNPYYATVRFAQRITGVNADTNATEVLVDSADSVMVWDFEVGRWKMYGDQFNAASQSLDFNHRIGRSLGQPAKP